MNKAAREEYLADFFDHAPVGFHVFGPDRKFLDVNQAELDMLGFTYEELVGQKSWSDLIMPEQRPMFEEHWKSLCATGKALNLYYTVIHKSGHPIRVLLNATAKLDAQGRVIHTRGSVLDITEKEAVQESLRAFVAEVSHQKQVLEQKNAALKEILAQIDIEKNHIKEEVMANVQRLILPVLAKLHRRGSSVDRQHIALLEYNLKEITSGFGRTIGDLRWKLTPREIEICDMIKNGLSTKEMAALLASSTRTVDNHRNRIRKKLEISQKNVNLTTYLQNLDKTT